MKKFLSKAGQILTGAAAAVTIFAGRVMAVNMSEIENPAAAGAEMARANGMPAELVGVNGVFTKIIYGGLRYVISGGDSKKVTDAKNTIMYAIIGLIIAILSYAIVNFVINSIGGTE